MASGEWPGWEAGLQQHLDASPAGRGGDRPAPSTWTAPRAASTPPGRTAHGVERAWSRSPRTTTSASPQHPAVVAAAHRGARPLGHRLGCGTADRRLPPRARRARSRARRLEGHRPRRAVPHRLRRQPRRAHARSERRPGVLDRVSATSSTTRRSSTAAGSPRPTSPSTATATSTPRRRTCAAPRRRDGRAIVVTDTVFSMDGDVADARRARRGVRPPEARCSCSTRPTPCSARDRRPTRPTPTSSGSARCRRRSARSAASSPAHARRRPPRQHRAARTSSPPRSTPADTAAGARRAARAAIGRRATRWSHACVPHVDRLRPGHPVADRARSSSATSSAALDAAAALLERRTARPRDPAADGGRGTSRLRVTLVRRRTPTPRSTTCSTRSPRSASTRAFPSPADRAPASRRRHPRR